MNGAVPSANATIVIFTNLKALKAAIKEWWKHVKGFGFLSTAECNHKN